MCHFQKWLSFAIFLIFHVCQREITIYSLFGSPCRTSLQGINLTFWWKLATKTNYAQMSRFIFVIYALFPQNFQGLKWWAAKFSSFCKYGGLPQRAETLFAFLHKSSLSSPWPPPTKNYWSITSLIRGCGWKCPPPPHVEGHLHSDRDPL